MQTYFDIQNKNIFAKSQESVTLLLGRCLKKNEEKNFYNFIDRYRGADTVWFWDCVGL